MGLLALDISGFGVVMSSDSQPVELLDGTHTVLPMPGRRSRRHIFARRSPDFSGLVGYVGTETIDGVDTLQWLDAYSAAHGADDLPRFCEGLGKALSQEWRRLRLKSVLWIFVSGVVAGDPRFWFVNNTTGLYPNWSYMPPTATFRVEDDLDKNYVPRDLSPGQTKAQLLAARLYSFRNGVLLPAALMFDGFASVMATIYAQRIAGFSPLASVDDLAFFARQRLEFTKRVYSDKHGLFRGQLAPLGGAVHVLGVATSGEIRTYGKHRTQVRVVQ